MFKINPFHPSLHLKKVGKNRELWSVRINDNYRALGVDKPEGIVWFWMEKHSDYELILDQ